MKFVKAIWLDIAFFVIVAILAILIVGRVFGQDPRAVIRVKSHGASAVVIHSAKNRTFILGCAHMLGGGYSKRPIHTDGAPQPKASQNLVKATLLAYDYRLDLSLIFLPNGPFYSAPVAPAGYRPDKTAWSMGYDEMRWPITVKRVSLLGTSGATTFTRERPWHGRSGGALMDSKGYTIGIVQGYEVEGPRRGMYISHAAILAFLSKHQSWLVGGQRLTPSLRGLVPPPPT